MLRQRLDPPQKAAVAVSVVAPLAVGAVYATLRTDWLQRVGGALAAGLRALVAQIAALPWVDIGYAFLVVAVTTAIVAIVGCAAFLTPDAVSILWRWRLTPAETLRAMAIVACGSEPM